MSSQEAFESPRGLSPYFRIRLTSKFCFLGRCELVFVKRCVSVIPQDSHTGRSASKSRNVRREVDALQCTIAGPYHAILTDLLRVGSVCGLGLDLFWICILCFAARFRTAANSSTLAGGLAKINAAREYDGCPFRPYFRMGRKVFENIDAS